MQNNQQDNTIEQEVARLYPYPTYSGEELTPKQKNYIDVQREAYLAGRKATALQLQRANESKRGIAERLLINLGENVQHYKHQGLSEEDFQHVFEAFAEATELDKQKVASEAIDFGSDLQVQYHFDGFSMQEYENRKQQYLNSLNKPD